ncbi:F-box only protein 9-like [Diadema antillarum]|uniref:F-box only protein 9-like n=1 Tax=Diadema antillarum TaxID=105358 RepID=UPI003A8686B1
MMANENLIVPVLDGDDDSDADEMLELEGLDTGNDDHTPASPLSLEQQLANFRQQWRQELSGEQAATPSPTSTLTTTATGLSKAAVSKGRDSASLSRVQTATNNNSPSPEVANEFEVSSLRTESVEEKAKYLFQQGVRLERIGKVYEAVMFYRQALQLVPDIESRVQESEVNSRSGSNQVSDDEENNNDVTNMMTESVDDNEVDRLAVELRAMTTNDLKSHCRNNTPQTATHISVLPVEVLLYIFRWVVSADLDLRSLEQLSRVCRGFYVCSRDSTIWRKACCRIWGKMAYLSKEYLSWRHMFVERPHPRYDGIYISRITYVRQGEPSMDSFYRPWHIVEYHRFLRLFPDGTLLLVNSSEDPQSVVNKMNRFSVISGKMTGRYCLVGEIVEAVLEKEKVRDVDPGRRYIRSHASHTLPESEQTFHMDLRICNHGHRPDTKLEWHHYACHTRYRSTGNVTVTEFDMNHQFSPFYFSRVKSYAKFSQEPL